MHELSIVMNIVEIAEKETAKANAHSIEEIELDIGYLSTVDIEAFEFAWEHAVKNTLLEHATKKINRIEGKAKCNICDTEFTIREVYDACPFCNSHSLEVMRGKDLRVKRIVLN